MSNMKTTKRALMSSVIALFLCFAMLLGTTYAWFTDSATSTGNKIKTGTLDVQLHQWKLVDEDTNQYDYVNIGDEQKAIFTADSILWEPGMTQVAYLRIVNNGNLALKYKVAIETTLTSEDNLLDVMSYKISPDLTAENDYATWADMPGTAVSFEKTNGMYEKMHVATEDVELLPQGEHYFALSIHMDELAGNEYMNETVEFDIMVLAGQMAYEADSFGTDYDALAAYGAKAQAMIGDNAAVELIAEDKDGYNIGSATVPAAMVDDSTKPVTFNMTSTNYEPTIPAADQDAFDDYEDLKQETLDITVDNVKKTANGDTVKLTKRISAGIDPDTVVTYHYNTKIDSSYNPNTGYISFETDDFSPFTFVYDAASEYVAPPTSEATTIPTAKVEYLGYNAGEESIEWESYDPWSPVEGLEANLEGSFSFKCPELDEKTREVFENWYCDFYLSLDIDLGANQIFLGGYYESFDAWVGFHNGDYTLKANEEMALLGSVVVNDWTYSMVEDFVGTFICGVGDVNDALAGATFTVKLRLTNPANEAEFYDVNTVTYTFGDAETAGSYEIK